MQSLRLDDPSFALYLLEGHWEHTVWLISAKYVPLPQQVPHPVPLLDVPGGHTVHVDEDDAPSV